MSTNDQPDLTLYSSRISNASARLRIALNLKKVPYKLISINLSRGEQHDTDFKALNASGTVPLLIHQQEGPSEKTVIGQSIAALEYLDEAFPETKRLMPKDPASRAHVRMLIALLASGMHPLLTHRVSKTIREMYPCPEAEVGSEKWDKHWVSDGLTKFEGLLARDGRSGKFCLGDEITLADVVLLPEFWFARRIGVDVGQFPRIERICHELCLMESVRKEEQTLEEK